jgi:hypothetical protein
MGNICCCCCPEHQQRRQQHAGFRTTMPAYHATAQQQRSNFNECRICGKQIDPSLIDGHEESCRIQARRNLQAGAARDGVAPQSSTTTANSRNQQQQPNYNSNTAESETAPLNPQRQQHSSSTETTPNNNNNGDILEDDSDRACVICLQNRKVVALLPCAHLCVCRQCSSMIDQCPLCRGKKESLLVINENAGKCRVCHNFIAPVYLDSHQEVCRLRMKELRKTLREESKKSAAQFAHLKSREASTINFTPQLNESETATTNKDDSENEMEKQQQQMEDLCLQCLVNKREKFALPCGHSLCTSCSEKVTVCSVCLQKVTSSITVYD